MLLASLRQIFCDHKESFAYRKYGNLDFIEFSSCKKCGKMLGHFPGFDEDMRG